MWGHLTSSLRKLHISPFAHTHTSEELRLVTVFGATGAQGSSVVHALLEHGKYKVRGITRDPDSKRAEKLKECGVEVVKADQCNEVELKEAMKGSYAVYVVTDFYSVGEKELEWGKRTVHCAKDVGVKHLIWSTLPNVKELSHGRLNVPHFTGKASLDATVRSLNFEHHTFLMCAFYFQNFAKFNLAKLSDDGTVVFEMPIIREEHMFTAFDVDDTGPAVVHALENPDLWQDQYICLAGYHAPMSHYIKIFEKVTGCKAALHTISESPVAEWTEMFRWIAEYTYYGTHDITIGRKAHPYMKSWEEWLRASEWCGPEKEKSDEVAAESAAGAALTTPV